MSRCEEYRMRWAVEHLGERRFDPNTELGAHLAQCSCCRREIDALADALEMVDRARPSAIGSSIWERLEPELDRVDRRRRRGRRSAAAAAALALAAAAIVVAIVSRPSVDPVGPAPELRAAVPRGDGEELVRFLARAEPLLLAVSNRGEQGAVGARERDVEQRRAHELATEAARLRWSTPVRSHATRALLDDLERIFLQIANLGESDYAVGIGLVQAVLDDRSILFQISVETMRRAAREDRRARA